MNRQAWPGHRITIVVALAAAGISIALALWAAGGAAAATETGAPKWQYRAIALSQIIEQSGKTWDEIMFLDPDERKKMTDKFEADLNAAGAEGWNLYYVGDYFVIFKRPAG